MSRAAELRAAADVAELEEQLAAAKDDGSDTTELKHELRYKRWVARGGHLADVDDDNRVDTAHRERYEQEAGA